MLSLVIYTEGFCTNARQISCKSIYYTFYSLNVLDWQIILNPATGSKSDLTTEKAMVASG
jgi:hypothetical protein